MNVIRRIASRTFRPLMFCLTLLVAPVVFAQTTVTTSFVIDSKLFTEESPETMLIETQEQLSTELAHIAQNRFGFLSWQPTNAADVVGPQLVVTMRDVANQNCTPAVMLIWQYRMGEQIFDIENIAQDHVYKACSANPPLQEPQRLNQEVTEVLKKVLANEANLENILQTFLSQISIANELINYENAMLLLPISFAMLNASPESQLMAKFKFAGQTPVPVPGRIELQPREEFGDSVQLFIRKIEVPAVDARMDDNGGFWHPLLADVLANSLDIRVLMISYQPSEDGGGTILDTPVLSEL